MSSQYQHGDDDVRLDAGGLLRAAWARAPRMVLVTALLVAMAFAVLMVVPRTYESAASLVVDVNGAASAEALMASQIGLIKSPELLLEVVDSQNLRAVPEFSDAGLDPVDAVLSLFGSQPGARSAEETVLANLSDRVTVVRESDMAIAVVVRSADAQLAAKIANAIAETHVRRRATQSLTDRADTRVLLTGEIDKQRAKVSAAETAVADYRVAHNLYGSSATPQFSTVAEQLADAQQKKNDAQSRAELIRGLVKSGQPLDGVADVRNSVVITGLLQTKANLQAELAQRSTTLLGGHPTIKALKAQVAEIEGQIRAESRKVADSLEAEAAVQGELEQKLRSELTRAQVASGEATKGGVTLDSLEREAKAQRDLLETYLARYNDVEARAAAGLLPSDVRIVSKATAATEPSSPRTELILGSVGFIALVLQIGGVLFAEVMSGRALIDRRAYEAVEEAVLADLHSADADDAALEAAVAAEMPKPTGTRRDDLRMLSAAVSARQLRTVLLAGVGDRSEVMAVVDRLVEDALGAGLSVVAVDAGSGDVSSTQGVSDLAAEHCDYGDVVQRASENLAEVGWGRLETINGNSRRPATLVEALADIYHVVIVDTGRVGEASSLPIFASLPVGVVLVASDLASVQSVVEARAEIKAMGFEVGRVVTLPTERAAVA